MNGENEADNGGELSKANVATALSGLFEKMFAATLVAPALSQVGLTFGDQVKFYRIKNLIRLNEHLEQVIKERNIDQSNLNKLSMSVGFPLLEKASYQDDEFLQKKWANLLASTMEKGKSEDDRFSLSITYIEIFHQFSRLDCEVLEYIAENGVSGRGRRGDKDDQTIATVPLNPLEIRNAFPGTLAHISLEKIVTLGCACRVLRTPLSTTGGDGYGSWPQDIVATLVGLNLYVAASGKKPKWYDVNIQSEGAEGNTTSPPEP